MNVATLILMVTLAGGDEVADDALKKGREALFRGDYKAAIELLEPMSESDDRSTRTVARLNLARALRYDEQGERAEQQLTAILEEAPDHVEAGQLLGEILHEGERWAQLREVLEPLLAYRHDYPTHHLLAEAAYHLEDYSSARRFYREAIRLNPASGRDALQLGNIDLAENRFALAASSYESAIRLGIDSPTLHYKLASCYFNLRNYFGRVQEIAVVSGEPGTLHGQWYLIESVPGQADRFRAAPRTSAVYQAALALERGLSEDADLELLLAGVYLNARRFEQAYERYAELADRVRPEDGAIYHYSFAQSALGRGLHDEYLAHLEQAIELDPEAYGAALVDAFLTVADAHNQRGDQARFLEFLARAVAESPQTGSLHLRLGDAYAEAGEFKRAVQQWRLVLDLEPDHPSRTELLNKIETAKLQPAGD